MSRLTAIRNTLSNRVFNDDLGTDITITPTNAGTASSDGGFTPPTFAEGASSTVKGVPFSNATVQLFKEMFGNATPGEGTVILPYTATVTVGDKVAWLSKTYYAEEVEAFPLGGGVAAYLVRCNERMS
jgi:hypothetical protein